VEASTWAFFRVRMRRRISSAALLVKVTARMSEGGMPRSMRRAIRWVTTRVLPEPAPARTRRGPSTWATASCCWGLSSAIFLRVTS